MSKLTYEEASHLNRHQRRALAKLNNSGKIPGASKPILNVDRQIKKYKKKHRDAGNMR